MFNVEITYERHSLFIGTFRNATKSTKPFISVQAQQGCHVENPSTISPKWIKVSKALLQEKALYKVQLEVDLP